MSDACNSQLQKVSQDGCKSAPEHRFSPAFRPDLRRRYLIVLLRFIGARRTAAQLLYRAATLVRMRVRLAVCRVRYAILVSAVAAPSVPALARYFVSPLRRCAASTAGVSAAGVHSACVAQSGPPAPRLPRAPEVAFLADARVQALQRSIIDCVLRLRFGVRATRHELAVLSRFSSVAWLALNLEVGAGIHRARLTVGERQYRVRVVYPVFFKLMRFHLGLSRSGAETTTSRAARVWLRLRRPRSASSVGPNGEILQSLYPQEITAEQIRSRRAVAEAHARRRYRAVRNREHLLRFDLYLKTVTLATHPRRAPAKNTQSSARIARAVNRITAEFYHQNTITH